MRVEGAEMKCWGAGVRDVEEEVMEKGGERRVLGHGVEVREKTCGVREDVFGSRFERGEWRGER